MTELQCKQIARKIVAEIERDFTDRRGLRQAWEQIDDGIQAEIRKTWRAIVKQAIADSVTIKD